MSVFNRAYQRPDLLFGDKPSEELSDFLDTNPVKGAALDLGCGDGRDTIPLLRRGLAVTAVDHSPDAIRKLVSRAESMGDMARALHVEVGDIRTWNWPVEKFDLIVAVTILDHITKDELLPVVERMVRAAGPDAVLFVEVHTVDDPGVTGEGPVSEFASEIRHYFARNELLDLFRSCARILRYEEKAEWDHAHGPPHKHGVAVLLGKLLITKEVDEL